MFGWRPPHRKLFGEFRDCRQDVVHVIGDELRRTETERTLSPALRFHMLNRMQSQRLSYLFIWLIFKEKSPIVTVGCV